MMLRFLCLPLALAAEFWNTNRNTSLHQFEADPATFDAFVRDLQDQKSPFDSWLIPPWIQYLRKCEGDKAVPYTELEIDEEFRSYLQFLDAPKIHIHEANQKAGDSINEFVKLQGKRLLNSLCSRCIRSTRLLG